MRREENKKRVSWRCYWRIVEAHKENCRWKQKLIRSPIFGKDYTGLTRSRILSEAIWPFL